MDKYAIIETGGKQYKVKEGDTVKIEKLPVEIGQSVDFDKVLLLRDGDDITVGKPHIENLKVQAEVVDQGRHKKIQIIKFRRRKHHMKRKGHRQYFTAVEIKSIA